LKEVFKKRNVSEKIMRGNRAKQRESDYGDKMEGTIPECLEKENAIGNEDAKEKSGCRVLEKSDIWLSVDGRHFVGKGRIEWFMPRR
jgi:hypothetical protein